ncbi:MAG: protein phosphatase 2C domain-containing protein [Bifidobacteriaceae bacterium]|nr:protein phosphatase 2C domain-containing protein [Bifidobacteriaceae bacterium]
MRTAATGTTSAADAAPRGWAVGIAHGQGERDYQQDRYVIGSKTGADELHLVIADGMGGAEDGEAIAEAAVRAVGGALDDLGRPGSAAGFGEVIAAIEAVSAEVLAQHRTFGGSTLIACWAAADRTWFASVGDSPLFLRRAERLFELGRRHEYRLDLWRQVLNGTLTLDEAEADPQADALASFIGCEHLSIDRTFHPIALEPGDTLLACTDGVSDTLSQGELRTILGLAPRLAADTLARRIESDGIAHQDNYTAIVARYYPGTLKPTDRLSRKDSNHEYR